MPLTLEPSPIVKALDETGITALRRIAVRESETTVELSGTVASYYLKQLAQETVRGLCGPRQLVNRLEVVRD
jgi:osmotically-inducible protein OsmY